MTAMKGIVFIAKISRCYIWSRYECNQYFARNEVPTICLPPKGIGPVQGSKAVNTHNNEKSQDNNGETSRNVYLDEILEQQNEIQDNIEETTRNVNLNNSMEQQNKIEDNGNNMEYE